jgi:hypothetical protein
MEKLEAVIPIDKATPCPECGGFVFFDWGLKVLNTAYISLTPRFTGAAGTDNVMVCAECHHPVVQIGSDFFDAVNFIPKATIETLIREGQARHHQVPVRAMDP